MIPPATGEQLKPVRAIFGRRVFTLALRDQLRQPPPATNSILIRARRPQFRVFVYWKGYSDFRNDGPALNMGNFLKSNMSAFVGSPAIMPLGKAPTIA
jgi:hypothetical protein